jgi:hypothetical protein
MRVYGPNGTLVTGPARETRRSDGPAFVLPQAAESGRPAPSNAVRPISSVDALLAVQAINGGAERRRRQAGRGRATLDTLDELKVGLLSGRVDRALLDRLGAQVAGLVGKTGDDRLDAILAEVEVRAAVELAKFGRNSTENAG